MSNTSYGDIYTFLADNAFVGMRLDVFLSDELDDISRSAFQKLIENGDVTINEKTVAKNYKIKNGDFVRVELPQPVELELLPQDLSLVICYEDNDLLVVNKPKGMTVHPAAGHSDNTLVNGLLFHCKDSLSGINGMIRPGIVHRIDKNTSGLLIVAKNDRAHKGLAKQIKEHSFLREYEAVVYGNVKNDSGTVDMPIGRSKLDRKKMCVTNENSKPAVTHYEVVERYNGFTHIKCRLETGRTHQIRVHMAFIGNPIAGDDIYGPKKVITKLDGQCLHAKSIGFVHPITGENISLTSELPTYFTDFLKGLSQ